VTEGLKFNPSVTFLLCLKFEVANDRNWHILAPDWLKTTALC